MIVQWLLFLLLAPGWLLPSGVLVPLCGCLFGPTESRGCCVVIETRSCCASPEEDESAPASAAATLAAEAECHCSVAVPTHEGGCARILADDFTPPAFLLVRAPGFLVTVRAAHGGARADCPRARGPSPGGPIPLPLRL